MSRVHKEYLNRHKVEILYRMAKHAKATGKNEIPLSVLRDDINDYNNAQKLRYHALIFKVKRGVWGITAFGMEFLKGEKDLPRVSYISDNRIQGKSSELVNIRDLVTESGRVAEQFEYLENGKTVLRPALNNTALKLETSSWL